MTVIEVGPALIPCKSELIRNNCGANGGPRGGKDDEKLGPGRPRGGPDWLYGPHSASA